MSLPREFCEMPIHGSQVALRPATEEDRRDVFAWLVASDVTESMMGPPTFTEVAIPSWEEFCADYASHFFDGSRPDRGRSFIIEVDGQPVGHVSYDGLDNVRCAAELDIWMRSTADCGHGYGTQALQLLMRDLADRLPVRKFIIRPSLRNGRAIRAYQKAGFLPSRMSPEQQRREYGNGEYSDTLTLERDALR